MNSKAAPSSVISKRGKHEPRQQGHNKGVVNILTEHITTIPLMTVAFFVLLFIAGFTNLLPRELINKIFTYVRIP
jgi:hypothetical protein